MMRVASLGSGSAGNGLVVQAGATALLLDCGFSVAETERRLQRLGLGAQQLAAIVVTHEHTDHIAGVAGLARRYQLPILASHGTLSALPLELVEEQGEVITGDRPRLLGDIVIEPFSVPHDAREPLQFTFAVGERRLGVLTDTGCVTPHILQRLSNCDALVLEANYDPELLERGPYPPALKARVQGRLGHLANAQAAEFLAGLEPSRLQWVVAAHISQRNNTPAHARQALAAALRWNVEQILLADQEQGFGWQTIC